MDVKIISELPRFDTGQYEDSEFLMKEGNATLTLHVHGLSPITIRFQRVRWHQFLSLHHCDAEWPKYSYFKLTEVMPSEPLNNFVARDTSPPYKELHHYRIFIDETGGHEVFAESCGILT